jgi:hypothetical protein
VSDLINDLERLAALLEKDLITREQFEEQRDVLMAGSAAEDAAAQQDDVQSALSETTSEEDFSDQQKAALASELAEKALERLKVNKNPRQADSKRGSEPTQRPSNMAGHKCLPELPFEIEEGATWRPTEQAPAHEFPIDEKQFRAEESITEGESLNLEEMLPPVKAAISQWSNAIPHHDLRDLGDRVEIKAVSSLPSYRLRLQSLSEERVVKRNFRPHRGDLPPPRTVSVSGYPIWSKVYEPPQDNGKTHTLELDGSHHAETCSTCDGARTFPCRPCHTTGEVECPSCNGRGETKCTDCSGGGRNSCRSCGGRGQDRCNSCKGTSEIDCIFCNNGRTHHDGRLCGHCGGRGGDPCGNCQGGFRQCMSCAGQGQQTCSTCSGRGDVRCSECQGACKITCYRCGGRGETDCSRCEAAGSTVSFLEMKVNFVFKDQKDLWVHPSVPGKIQVEGVEPLPTEEEIERPGGNDDLGFITHVDDLPVSVMDEINGLKDYDLGRTAGSLLRRYTADQSSWTSFLPFLCGIHFQVGKTTVHPPSLEKRLGFNGPSTAGRDRRSTVQENGDVVIVIAASLKGDERGVAGEPGPDLVELNRASLLTDELVRDIKNPAVVEELKGFLDNALPPEGGRCIYQKAQISRVQTLKVEVGFDNEDYTLFLFGEDLRCWAARSPIHLSAEKYLETAKAALRSRGAESADICLEETHRYLSMFPEDTKAYVIREKAISSIKIDLLLVPALLAFIPPFILADLSPEVFPLVAHSAKRWLLLVSSFLLVFGTGLIVGKAVLIRYLKMKGGSNGRLRGRWRRLALSAIAPGVLVGGVLAGSGLANAEVVRLDSIDECRKNVAPLPLGKESHRHRYKLQALRQCLKNKSSIQK